jgi:hypothetical protein
MIVVKHRPQTIGVGFPREWMPGLVVRPWNHLRHASMGVEGEVLDL